MYKRQKLDNTELDDYIKEGMSIVKAPEKRATGRRSPPPVNSPERRRRDRNRESLDTSQHGPGSGPAPGHQTLGAGDSTGASASVSDLTGPPKEQRKKREEKSKFG